MFRTHLLVVLVVSTFSAPVMAEGDPLQSRVQDYCGKVSSIILQAAADYNHQLSNAVKPEDAKISVMQKVRDSEEYVSASPAVKAEMDRAVSSSTDYTEHSRMMDEQNKVHERYIGVHAWTWAYRNVTPFTAWCNYNHIQG
ncbi:hypothetical protein E0I03_01780 [Dickeya dadantii]|uniref:hypothetical protein n=1 Tax=Dickeya dadantii TaxID=204038 RepID=UPI0014960E35|nr:hypothetical protein [Dickeya dadantii]NPE49957.1 hypothetical protein [Dickeya dadantii]